ncbi:hypothetical protein F4553_005272 [Allocatelliglobosispora scoriae]|uniref:Uncharacterized protein n=1 Tax=Allocatelliglobosispora scoriae TaxID=643052 RepID=A0A841BY92_9ACTN|nr:hypothetical protein [Allocatelliglobosispora scoriae]MBB5871893.1 hypothetical protein [Allocatelliglobosispora scoriae]
MAVDGCVFCSGPVSGQGEHVLPNWVLYRFDNSSRSFTSKMNGTPLGRPIPHHPRVRLKEVCGHGGTGDCNRWLNMTFEDPMRPAVKKALTGIARLDETNNAKFAQWLLKTMLLLAHPQTRWDGSEEARGWSDYPETWLPNLKATGMFPDDLSCGSRSMTKTPRMAT